jgi:HlyD family secretion protein
MRGLLNRRVVFAILIVGGLLAVAVWPSAVPVDLGTVVRGPLVVSIGEEGRTRVRERYVVSAPVAGRVLRINLEPGDEIERGQVVARVRAEVPPLLDARTRAEAQAALDSARASNGRAQAEEQRARAALAQLQREVARLRELARNRVVSTQELEVKEAEARSAEESVNAAAFALRATASEVQRARVRLNPSPADPGRVVTLTAPIAGVVLKRLRESESVVPAGDPLLEIGNPLELEIVADLLSTDAVRLRPGARAMIEEWGGQQTLDARVRRIEPAGFTKISALGVEEQRVNVILDFADPEDARTALGDAYRVEVRVVEWEARDVIKVPTSALFREGAEWAVYVVENGRARLTIVKLGHQTGQDAEVTAGLLDGARVVLHPADTLSHGARVRIRSASSL